MAKVSDFGLSLRLYQSQTKEIDSGIGRPIRWMAPEVLKNGSTSSMSDVWSYGIVLWEIFEFGTKFPYGNRGKIRVSNLVVLNRGAVKSSRSATNLWARRLFTSKLQLGVPQNCSIGRGGCRESKKVEKHCFNL